MKRIALALFVDAFFAIHPAVNAVEPCTDDIDTLAECPLEGCGPPRVDGKLNEQCETITWCL